MHELAVTYIPVPPPVMSDTRPVRSVAFPKRDGAEDAISVREKEMPSIYSHGICVFLQYTSAAVAMPWEVGKTLLQVQYVPCNLKLLEERTRAVEDDEVSPNVSVGLIERYYLIDSAKQGRVSV